MYTTGIPTCDQLREVAFTGNVIPQIWYRVFVKSDLKHPKPHLLAINILADIVYWYRPREIRDEGSGQVIGYQKKFKDDLLQRSYAQIAEQFGCSAGQAKDAIVFLEEMGVVRREFRTLKALSNELSVIPGCDQVSMGMSEDWPIAVEEGTTLVRIGTSIFGKRN